MRGRDGVNESPSPDWKNILLWQLGEKKCCSLHVSNLEQVSKRLPLPVLVSGWYLDSTWDVLHLYRKRKKNLISLRRKCCEVLAVTQVLHSTPLLPHGAVWEDPQAPCTLISCPEDQRVQSKVQAEPALASKPSRRSFDRVAEDNLGHLPLQLTSGCCREQSTSLLSLPPLRPGIAEPPSLFWFLLPPFLLPFCPSASLDVAVES